MERWEGNLDRVFELTALLGRDANEALARMGLTASRAHLIMELRQRGPCTQRALADSLGVAPRTITTLIDALVATGFVTREPHPSDRRATLVTFTPHGEDTARTLAEGRRHLARQLFEDLPDDVLGGFEAGLVHIVDRLRTLIS